MGLVCLRRGGDALPGVNAMPLPVEPFLAEGIIHRCVKCPSRGICSRVLSGGNCYCGACDVNTAFR